MANPFLLCGRGLTFVKQYGPALLYYKIKERRERNALEAGYDAWIRAQLPDRAAFLRQRAESRDWGVTFSILVPAYETPEKFLREMIDSVLEQSYEKVTLCIADGSPTDSVESVVRSYQERDSRLVYSRLTENQGISENTNAALELATGAYVGLLDHDDILLPGALYEAAKVLEKSGADALYTDEDKVNMDLSRHFQPHFKPDFNLEYLCSNNYICHFFVVKRELAEKIGGFRPAFDGAQDHDFILRCTEHADRVLHIPKVLYSWRCHEASTASNPESKLYAYEAGKRSVAAHLSRFGLEGEVLSTSNYGFYRVRYRRNKKFLINSFENLHGQSAIKVVYYVKACNNSVTFSGKIGEEDYVLFTCVKKGHFSEDFFEELTASLARPGVGAVCARVYGRDKRLTSEARMTGVADPFGRGMKGLKKGCTGYFHRAVLQQEVTEATDCFLVRPELLEEFPEGVGSMEWCEKIREQGYRVVYDPWAVLYEDR